MSLLSQKITNLLNGVSQRPQEQRLESQADVQENALSHPIRGLMTRPPAVHVGKLTADTTGWADAFVHPVNRTDSERYHVVVANGSIFVYDAITLTPVTVLTPDGTAYLADAAGAGFRAATAGDTTIIVNRGVTVKQAAKKQPVPRFEALVYIRQADYATIYEVTLNGVTVSIQTIAANDPNARQGISTDKIAGDLYTTLLDTVELAGFSFSLYGSTIYITRPDQKDFSLTVSDGLADKGLKAVKGSVQSFADLPRRAVQDFVVEIAGDPETASDNYWVQYDNEGNPNQDGVWRECPKPGTPLALDATTLPHRLVRYGDVLKPTAHVSISDAALADISRDDTAFAGVSSPDWATLTPANTAITAGTQPVLQDQGEGVKLTLGVNAGRVYLTYQVDMSVVDPGNDVTVTFYQNGTALYSKTHAHSTLPPIDVISMPGTPKPVLPDLGSGTVDLVHAFSVNDVIELKISYATGVQPDTYRRAFVTPSSPSFVNIASSSITFDAAATFPVGTSVTVTADGTDFTHTVSGADESPDTVAAALQALIDPSVNFQASVAANVLSIARVDGLNATLSVTVTLDATTTFFNPSLAMVANEFVGYTLTNKSDGSTGTIVSNTATTIVVSGLSGGVDNVFSTDDVISVSGVGRYFIFEPCPWDERGAGDLDVVPMPSFVGATITDTVFYQNRLGFISEQNLVMSAAGDVFNFFRQTATDLLADDMIDVKSAHRQVALFHSMVLWNGKLYLLSDTAEWLVSGEPVLTPTTIRIDLVGQYVTSGTLRPAVAGSRLQAARTLSGYTLVSEFTPLSTTSDLLASVNLTEDVPKYLAGSPLLVAGDDTLGFLALVTDANGSKDVYAYSYAFDEQQNRVQSSWSKWTFAAGQIVGLDCINGQLSLLTVQSDGVYLTTLDLNVTLDTITTDEGAQYLDRRVENDSPGVSVAYNAGTDTTTWTLPYAVATDGSEGTLLVVKRSPAVTVLAATRPASNQIAVTGQGDLSAASVYLGVKYTYTYTPSRIYIRGSDGRPETRGWLTLRYLTIAYQDTTSFTVTVTLQGRLPIAYPFTSALPDSGTFRVPIQGKNEYATITITNDSPGVVALSSLDWEGSYSTRSKRV